MEPVLLDGFKPDQRVAPDHPAQCPCPGASHGAGATATRRPRSNCLCRHRVNGPTRGAEFLHVSLAWPTPQKTMASNILIESGIIIVIG